MAGLDAAAGIVGLTGFAYHLTRSLYEAGSAFAAARKETKRIARNVNNYANVLDMLNDLIEKDESLMSNKAYNLVGDIIDQSYDLFDEIEQRLSGSRANREDLKVGEKLKWMFRKSKVEPLVREIESLKTNVAALQGVLCFGGILKAARDRGNEQRPHQTDFDAQKLEAQRLKAENSIVDHLDARSHFFRPDEAKDADHESSNDSGASSEAKDVGEKSLTVLSTRQRTSLQISIRCDDPLSRISESLEDVHDDAKRQVLLLQNTHGVLQDLVEEWTTLSESTRASGLVLEQQAPSGRDSHDRSDESASPTPPTIRESSLRQSDRPEYRPIEHRESLRPSDRPERHESLRPDIDPRGRERALSRSRATSRGASRLRGVSPRPPPTNSLPRADPSTPLGKIQALASTFHTQWLPQTTRFITNPPPDLLDRQKEHLRLSESIMTQIVLKADDIDVEGNNNARYLRRKLILRANRVISALDGALTGEPNPYEISDDGTLSVHSSNSDSDVGIFYGWTSPHDESRAYIAADAARHRLQERPTEYELKRLRSKKGGKDNDKPLPPSRSQKDDGKRTTSTKSKQKSQREKDRDERARRIVKMPSYIPHYDRDGIKRDR